jgi:small-conductance mechanosensitive channel
MMEIAGINVIQVIEVVIALATTYIIAKIISRSLEKIFEKTPFPEQIERGIVKVSKYIVYIIGFSIVSFLGFDLSSVIVGWAPSA